MIKLLPLAHSLRLRILVAGAFGFFAWLLSCAAFAQAPANDDPCGAVTLTPQGTLCLAPTAGTNQFSTTTSPSGYQNNGSCGSPSFGIGNPKDVWYKFTTAATGLGSTGATVTVTGNAAGQVRLFSAATCAGPFTDMGCAAATAANTPAPPLVTTALTANTTYYVRVSGYSGNDQPGPFTICVTDGPGFVPCQNPQLGPVTYTTAANTDATFTFTPAPNNTGPYTARLTAQANITPLPPPVIFAATPPTIAVSGLVPGGSYLLEINGFCSTGGTVGARQNFVVPVPSDEPCTAQALPVDPGSGCSPVSGATTGATVTPPNGYTNPGCGGATGPDVWYTVTTSATGPSSTDLVLTVSNVAAAGQVRLFAASSCAGPFTQVACAGPGPNTSGAVPLVATGLVPNTTYYVSVTRRIVGGAGTFTICASAQPPLLPCPALASVGVSPTVITPTSAPLTLYLATGAAPPVSITVTYTPQGGSPLTLTLPFVQAPGSVPLMSTVLSGLTPATTYTVTAVANCAGGTVSPPVSTTFTTLPAASTPPPPNDVCGGATPLPVGTSCVASTGTSLNATGLDATAGYATTLTCGPVQSNDVWFSAVVPANGVVQFTTGPVPGSAVTSTGLALYSGPCGQLTQVGCSAGLLVQFGQARAMGLVPGSMVYARVWRQFNAAGGEFTVCATTDTTCPLATNLAASALTPTSATLTFTLPAGGSGFTLTYTPAGGTAQTVPVTGSPVQLTGLLPNTRYAITLTTTCMGALPGTVQTSFTTPAVPTCTAPAAVYTGNVTTTSAGVGFVVNPAASSYRLTYQAAGGPLQTLTPAPTASPVQLTGLVPGTAYTVCVASACSNGLSSVEACAPVFTTAGTAPSCLAPTGVLLTNVTPTSASVSFSPANGGAAGYTATASPAAGGPAVTVTGSVPPLTFQGLAPNTAYTMTVVANCPGNTTSPSSAPASFATPLAARSTMLAAQLTLTPNPAHHSVTLTVPAALLRQASLLTLADALGRAVYQRYVTPASGATADTHVVLDVSTLPAGVYLVRLLSSAGPITTRLVVE